MSTDRVFVFGEAEKGHFRSPLFINCLPKLFETLGHPCRDSLGISYAVQTLLFEREVIFYRIEEEGFNYKDYLQGLHYLQQAGKEMQLSAIGLPGVGDKNILTAITPLCQRLNCLLILSESDLFDYLTSK